MAKKRKSTYQNGGPVNTSGPTASKKPVDEAAMNAIMKARLAYAHMFSNPAAQRLVSPTDNPYNFGNGDVGTHFMSSIDNYAVPQIQNENGQLQLGDYGPKSNEAIRFDSNEDANYFAEENYKKVSPAFQQKAYGGGIPPITPTWNYPSKGARIYRDTSEVPPLALGNGGPLGDGTYTYSGNQYKKVKGKWLKHDGSSFKALSSGNIAERIKILEKNAISFTKNKGTIFNAPNKTLTYKNDSEWFNNQTKYFDGSTAYDEEIRHKVYSGKYGYNPSTGTLYKLDSSQQAIVPSEIKKMATRQSSADITKKEKEFRKGKIEYTVPVEEAHNPYGAAEAGKKYWLTPKQHKEAISAQISHNMRAVQKHPLWQLPGMVYGAAATPITQGIRTASTTIPNLAKGTKAAVNTTLNTPIGNIPHLTAGNLTNAYFASRVPGSIEKVYNNPNLENITSLGLDLTGTGYIFGGGAKAFKSGTTAVKPYIKSIPEGVKNVATGKAKFNDLFKRTDLSRFTSRGGIKALEKRIATGKADVTDGQWYASLQNNPDALKYAKQHGDDIVGSIIPGTKASASEFTLENLSKKLKNPKLDPIERQRIEEALSRSIPGKKDISNSPTLKKYYNSQSDAVKIKIDNAASNPEEYWKTADAELKKVLSNKEFYNPNEYLLPKPSSKAFSPTTIGKMEAFMGPLITPAMLSSEANVGSKIALNNPFIKESQRLNKLKELSPNTQEQRAHGGSINNINNNTMAQEQLTEFNGPSHEQNSLQGIPVGPNATVEGNETLQAEQDYVYSDRNILDEPTAAEFGLSKKWVGKTFAEASKLANRPDSKREDDVIEQKAIARDLDKLREAQEAWKARELEKDMAMMQEKHPEAMAQMMQAQQAQQAPQQPQGPPMQEGQQQEMPPQMEQGAMPPQQGMPQQGMEQMPPQGAPQMPQQQFALGGFTNRPAPGDPPKKRVMPEEYANLKFVNNMTWDDLTPTQQEVVHYQMNQKKWYDETSSEWKPYPGQPAGVAGIKQLADAKRNPVNSYNQYIKFDPKNPSGVKMSSFTNPIVGGMDREWTEYLHIPRSALKAQIGISENKAHGGYSQERTPYPNGGPLDDAGAVGTNIDGTKGITPSAGYITSYNNATGTTMPANAVITQDNLDSFNNTGFAPSWNSPDIQNQPAPTGITPTQVRGIVKNVAPVVPSPFRKGEHYKDAYNRSLPVAPPTQQGAPVGNVMSPTQIRSGAGVDLRETFNRPEINYNGLAGGGFVRGLGAGMEKVAPLIGGAANFIIPGSGALVGGIIGAGGAALENVGTGADFKEVMKDAAIGGGKGAIGGIVPGGGAAAGAAMTAGQMAGQAGLQVAGQAIGGLDNYIDNNTLDASEIQTLQEQKALKQGEYNEANPNVAAGGVAAPFAYGGSLVKNYANGGGIGINPEELLAYSQAASANTNAASNILPGFDSFLGAKAAKEAKDLAVQAELDNTRMIEEVGRDVNNLMNPQTDYWSNRNQDVIQENNIDFWDDDGEDYNEDDLYVGDETLEEKEAREAKEKEEAEAAAKAKKEGKENDFEQDLSPTGLQTLGKLSPAILNAIRGFSPIDELAYKDYQDKSTISRPDPLNISPYRQGINEQYQMALSRSRQGGQGKAYAQSLMNTANKNLGTAFNQKQQFDASQKLAYEQRVQKQNVSNLQTKAAVEDINRQSKAKKRAYFGEAATQVADMISAQETNKIDMLGLQLYAPDYMDKVGYVPYGKQLQNKIMGRIEKRKANKTKKNG